MDNWHKTLKHNYREAAQRLQSGGWKRRRMQRSPVKEVFVKDGHAVYLGRKLGSAEFTTFPINL